MSEKELTREFEVYGPIERLRIVRDKEGKSRGYAFVVYERERDMRSECQPALRLSALLTVRAAAYKEAEGIKIGGRRIMVDVERGRTVKDWKPMRLGGGLGGATRKKKEVAPPPDMMCESCLLSDVWPVLTSSQSAVASAAASAVDFGVALADGAAALLRAAASRHEAALEAHRVEATAARRAAASAVRQVASHHEEATAAHRRGEAASRQGEAMEARRGECGRRP